MMTRLIWIALLSTVFSASFSPAGEIVSFDTFAYPNQIAASRTWQASPLSPRVVAGPAGQPGLTFYCPFSKDIPRVYWDKAVSLDLSRCSSIEFDLSCDRPEAFRSLNLYLKSGDGWYVWSGFLPESGRQRVLALKGDFAVEGKPAGWNRIKLVRLSAWRGIPADTDVTVYSMEARADSILLDKNTTASPSPIERGFASKVNQRLSRWLRDMNIPHGIVTDEDVESGALGTARVAILGYNPHPLPAELEALKKFVQRGGKLIVFYAADAGLADLMRVRLESYKRSKLPGEWSSFAFTDPDEWHVPKEVFQESFNLMPAFPADRSARVIAWWQDAQGRRADEPAWLASDSGLWMTHVLLDDNAQKKHGLLLGLLGQYEPSVWQAAARAGMNRVGKIDSFRSLEESVSAIAAQADTSSKPEKVKNLLARTNRLYRDIAALYEQGKYREVIDRCGELRENLVEAYGRIQRPKAREFRGVWEHNGTGWFPGNWDRTCKILAGQGITAVFPNMLWGGLAHYSSKVLPQSFTVRQYGDQLAQCVKAAHASGLQVHVWKICWNLSGAPREFVERMKRQNRLQITAAGRTFNWLCPSHPQNIALELASLKEVVSQYRVDGIHLDYIRFPSREACYCASCRAAFEDWIGGRIGGWPKSAQTGGKLSRDFLKWRASRITDFARMVREQLRVINPNLKLSAAVWGNYPACADSMGQDWAAWLKEETVDFVCPMNYTADLSRFSTLTHAQLGLPRAKGRVFPGLGVTAGESQLRADQVIEQIIALRKLGAGGFMLFDLSHTLREETLPALSWGLTAP
jgi:uncharacterized lipoprotein YddW (UPF0748 family)